MGNRELALAALIGMSAIGFLLADGERRRVKWIRAMRRCLLRFGDMVRYERRGICALLESLNLSASPQERMLTKLLHACAASIQSKEESLGTAFARESARMQEYGVLGVEDREAFERVLGELGKTGLTEQLRLIDEADEHLRRREELLTKVCAQRCRLLRTLGVCCGAGFFLILV